MTMLVPLRRSTEVGGVQGGGRKSKNKTVFQKTTGRVGGSKGSPFKKGEQSKHNNGERRGKNVKGNGEIQAITTQFPLKT